MKKLWVVIVACVSAVGCAEPVPIDRVQVLRPGQGMKLEFRSECSWCTSDIQEERHVVWPDEDESPHVVIKRTETPRGYTERYDLDVHVAVSAIPRSESVEAKMAVSRLRIRPRYEQEGKDPDEWTVEYKRPSPNLPSSSKQEEEAICAKMLDGAEFLAIVDPNGRVVSAKAVGDYWKEMQDALSKAVEGESERIPFDVAIRLQTLGIFSSLDDLLAYLPPQGAVVGQSWTVRRDNVVPYSPSLAFAMMMEGGCYAREESTCRLAGIRETLRGRVADITIQGKRLVLPPRPDRPEGTAMFVISGRAAVNLTTGAVEKLRIESTPVWNDAERQSPVKAGLVHEISLMPE